MCIFIYVRNMLNINFHSGITGLHMQTYFLYFIYSTRFLLYFFPVLTIRIRRQLTYAFTHFKFLIKV